MSVTLNSSWDIPGVAARLFELHALKGTDYLSFSQIAEVINREFGTRFTRNAVVGRVHRLDLPGRPTGSFRKPKPAPRPKMVKVRPRVDAPTPPPEPRRSEAGLTIYQLGWGDCRWILEPVDAWPPYTYCGAETAEGKSYCPVHHDVTHHKVKALTV